MRLLRGIRLFGFAIVFMATALVADSSRAQKLQLVTSPEDAQIFLVDVDGSMAPLGTGRAEYRVRRSNTNTIVVTADGYAKKEWTFVRGNDYPTPVRLELDTRVVEVSASDQQAEIFLNDVRMGTGQAKIMIGQNETALVEARLEGYWPASATYSTTENSGVIPLADELRIQDRMLVVNARPAGTVILADGVEQGQNFAEIRLPFNACVEVEANADNFVSKSEVFCNQERMEAPPMNYAFELTDREVTVRTVPQTASILLSGRTVGIDEYTLVVQQDECIEVRVEQSGYVSQNRSYCNQGSGQLPEIDVIELSEDEAFVGSQASDQANTNITIEVGEQRTFDDAWKIMSLIVLNAFDILEITDKETGYLRTAWAVERFDNATVRTRTIVKQGDISPVKFVVQIDSEYSEDPEVSVSCDRCFRPWDRLLYQYEDIINEMIFRLR